MKPMNKVKNINQLVNHNLLLVMIMFIQTNKKRQCSSFSIDINSLVYILIFYDDQRMSNRLDSY